ncbi:MAG: hypothetical protein ACRCZI_11985 [Cetobacterium sp.]
MDFSVIISIFTTLATDKDLQEKIIQTVFSVMVAAQGIVNLTPTPKDDTFVGKVYKVVEFLAGIWTAKAKQKPGGQ